MEPIKQGDKWYLPITGKQAYDLRLDVPLFFLHEEDGISADQTDRGHYIKDRVFPEHDCWWTEYKYYIEVGDPDGE